MSNIAIVGAGQSGLQLALSLLAAGYRVTLMTNRDALSLHRGRVMSSQCMFHQALETERRAKLNFWEEDTPPIKGIRLTMANPQGTPEVAFSWHAALEQDAQSVDQRLKMPGWMAEFENCGGRLVIADVGIAELEHLSADHDLVLLAGGKGEIVNHFAIDSVRTQFDRPQRVLALTYVHGMQPMENGGQINFNFIPGVGEYYTFPAFTLSGPCNIMGFEGLPGGEMDCWQEVYSAGQHLQQSLFILRRWLPWEADRCVGVELTDAMGIMAGCLTTCVRQPVLTLPSGRQVLGMADAVVLNDPIAGQGSNSAAKCAEIYLQRILTHGDGAFDKSWMEETFEQYWGYMQHVVRWTNNLLQPPQTHVMQLLESAAHNASLAKKIANAFDDPRRLDPWWYQAEEAQCLIS